MGINVTRPKRTVVCCDVDDVIAITNATALEITNKKYGTNFDIKNIKAFNYEDGSLKYREELYNDPDFIRNLPLYPGAYEFIQKVRAKYDLYFVTAVYPKCMNARVEWIKENFPDFPDDHILLGAAKNLVKADFLLDDRSENILQSIAKYPVLFRQPWNQDLSGILSVKAYDDFLHIVETVTSSYDEEPDFSEGGIVCLIGPSGSGKTAIMRELTENPEYVKPITTTTRTRRPGESTKDYNFVSKASFLSDAQNGVFMETTSYGGNFYGTKEEDISKIISEKKFAVLPIDICGAITLKNKFKEKCILIFIERNKSDVISTIIERDSSNSEKVRRIVSLDWEYQNKVFCDAIIENTGTLKSIARTIKKIIRGEL